MASSIQICTSCKIHRANPGYKWCEPCYIKSRSGPAYSHCRHCGNPPNPGFDLCDFCFKKEEEKTHKPRGRLCLICVTKWAENGLDLCKDCITSLDDPKGLLVNQVCNRCHQDPPNPGFLVCEKCYRNERAMNIHGSYFNAIAQTQLARPSFGGFRPIIQVDSLPSIISDFASSTGSSSPERDPRTLLSMGSTYVTTKHKEAKTSSATDTDYYHCICPHCYSDTSREDLFYCTHCLVSVVQLGDNICNSCRNNLK